MAPPLPVDATRRDGLSLDGFRAPNDTVAMPSETAEGLSAIERSDETVVPYAKRLVESSSPELWLWRICQHAASPSGVVKLCYDYGYVTVVVIGNADACGRATTVSVRNYTDVNLVINIAAGMEVVTVTNDDMETITLNIATDFLDLIPSNDDTVKEHRMIRAWPCPGTERFFDRIEDMEIPVSTSEEHGGIVGTESSSRSFVPLVSSLPDSPVVEEDGSLVGTDSSTRSLAPLLPEHDRNSNVILVHVGFRAPGDTVPRSCETPSAIIHSGETVAAYIKRLVEEASPELLLRLICQHAASPSGVVKLCYGGGFETVIVVGNADASGRATTVAVGITTDVDDMYAAAGFEIVGTETPAASQLMWDYVTTRMYSVAATLRIFITMELLGTNLSLNSSNDTTVKEHRAIRVHWPCPDDESFCGQMEEIQLPVGAAEPYAFVSAPLCEPPPRSSGIIVELRLVPPHSSNSRHQEAWASRSEPCMVDDSQTVVHFLKHHIEDAYPMLFLPLICQFAQSPCGVVRLHYGDNYDTVIVEGKAPANRSGFGIALGLSFGSTSTSDISWTPGTDLMVDLARESIAFGDQEWPRVDVYLHMKHTNIRSYCSQQEKMQKHRKIRIWLNEEDASVLDKMEELRLYSNSAPRARGESTRPVSNQIVQQYVDSLSEEDRFKSCEGEVRKELYARVFPHLTEQQQKSFTESVDKGEVWLSKTLRRCRKIVIHPEYTARKYASSRKEVGDDNGHSKEAQMARNQRPDIKEFKHAYQERQLEARQLQREAELSSELDRNEVADRDSNQLRAFALEVYNRKGFLEPWPDKSIKELVDGRVIATYFGLTTNTQTWKKESLRFLIRTDKTCPPLMWNMAPYGPRQLTKGHVELLQIDSKLIDKKDGHHCGFEFYCLERTFHGIQRDLDFGTQRLNRVVGVGDTYRGVTGDYGVFVTWVPLDAFSAFPNLWINEHNNKVLRPYLW